VWRSFSQWRNFGLLQISEGLASRTSLINGSVTSAFTSARLQATPCYFVVLKNSIHVADRLPLKIAASPSVRRLQRAFSGNRNF
jgi:hypothetical protein